MICWIHKKDLNAYMQLCAQEGTKPHIIEENEENVHVGMTNSVSSTWMAAGYWAEMG